MSNAHILARFAPQSHAMTQNLLTALKASFAYASMRSCGLLQYGYIRFRCVRDQCFLWLVLAIALLKLPFASEVERMSVQIRYFSAIARIDFLSIYELLNDLLW
ncbi:hypothetical protein H6G20_23750 [Desertifilum sp. FACHB-1129]|uniref:Uncharacterized protein n=2 Tax=Desertifilaceae TaxID=1969992 RepID=A0A1E5QHT0_9CYAN|nr:hypothetical protein [Desertifilum sp. FACHB-1129]MBD2320253.1 hypothetical protein [Desertifilum sp. FACHB-866]MBD2330381.1 hypothetical protein [Desertifilum sp. FACHB-868]OEJ74154.1 hypothetical protein BH720_16100 [Desertifilum tharense IPPAS B-1220]